MNFSHIRIPEDNIFYKSELSFAFVNLRPFLPYHILVSPKRCVQRLSQLSDSECADIFATIRTLIAALDDLGEAWTISLQDGEAAGQTVKHLHFHVLPRKTGDLENNNDVYKGIALDMQISNRSQEEMRAEATFLRNMVERHLNKGNINK